MLVSHGERARGLEVIDRALELKPDDFGVLYNAACANTLAGELDRALELLDRAVATGSGYRTWIDNDSDLDAIRAHPRFKEIVARLPP
jgi:adenylate cyclase